MYYGVSDGTTRPVRDDGIVGGTPDLGLTTYCTPGSSVLAAALRALRVLAAPSVADRGSKSAEDGMAISVDLFIDTRGLCCA